MKDIHTFVILAHNENDDLEDCIKSIKNQSVKSNIIIATSTPCDFINDVASKYGIGVMVNKRKNNIGSDCNYAISTFNTELITIAHQSDIYNRNYLKEVIKVYKKNKDATIIYSDAYLIKDGKKIVNSYKLRKNHKHNKLLKYKLFQKNYYAKIYCLARNQSFKTSSVTFIKNNIPEKIFPTNLKYYNEWQGFINLAKNNNSKFIFIDKKLVGYQEIDKKKRKSEKRKEEKKKY